MGAVVLTRGKGVLHGFADGGDPISQPETPESGGCEPTIISGKIETGRGHLKGLINVGELVEAVVIASFTISQQHDTHLGARFVIKQTEAAVPLKGCGVAVLPCRTDFRAVAEDVRDESDTGHGVYVLGRCRQPVKRGCQRFCIYHPPVSSGGWDGRAYIPERHLAHTQTLGRGTARCTTAREPVCACRV